MQDFRQCIGPMELITSSWNAGNQLQTCTM